MATSAAGIAVDADVGGRLPAASTVADSDNAGFAQTAVVQVTSRGPEPDPAAQTPADRRPRRTVLTFGCFDLFHFGHLRYLQRAAALGDRLVVGLTSDPVRWSTSRKVPTVCQQQRVDIVRAIKGVDQVFLNFADYKGDGKLRHIMEHFFERYGIDVFVAGDEPSVRRAYAAACLEDFVELVYLPRTAGVSSTELKLKLGGGAPAPAEAPQEASPAEVAAGSLLSGVTTASEIAEWVSTGASIDQKFSDRAPGLKVASQPASETEWQKRVVEDAAPTREPQGGGGKKAKHGPGTERQVSS